MVLQMVRSSLLLGAAFMLVGPLMVFTPKRTFYVSKKRRVLRALVQGANKESTRHVSFAVFLVVVAAQLVVLYSLSLVLRCGGTSRAVGSLGVHMGAPAHDRACRPRSEVFRLAMVDVIGLCACYIVVVLFYLLAFTATVLRWDGTIRGHRPLKFIRYVLGAGIPPHCAPSPHHTHSLSHTRARHRHCTASCCSDNVKWLETKTFLYIYVALYTLKLLAIVAVATTFLVQDIQEFDKLDEPKEGSRGLSIFFYILTLAATVTFAVFLLIEAFRLEEVRTQPRCVRGPWAHTRV